MPSKSCNVVHKLASRQEGSTVCSMFTQIPARLQFPIETLIDSQNKLLGCVLLGFTADGDHLLSYTATHGYRLQIWTFQWGGPSKQLADVKLFTGTDPDAAGTDSSDEDSIEDAWLPVSMALSVTETADRRLLVVHGHLDCTEEEDTVSDSRQYVTVMPHPCTHHYASQGFHYCYWDVYGRVSQPMFALLGSDTLLLHSSRGVQFLHIVLLEDVLMPSSQAENQPQQAVQGSMADPATSADLQHTSLTEATRHAVEACADSSAHVAQTNKHHASCSSFTERSCTAAKQSTAADEPIAYAQQQQQAGLSRGFVCACSAIEGSRTTGQKTSGTAQPSPGNLDRACQNIQGIATTMQGHSTAPTSIEQLISTDGLSQHGLASQTTDVSKPLLTVGRGIKPSRSVWSLSSSSASDGSSPHASSSNPHSASQALLLPEEHVQPTAQHESTEPFDPKHAPLEGLTHFSLGIKQADAVQNSNKAASVTGKMLGPAFDPEGFVMKCLSKQRANKCTLVDYAIKPVLFSESGKHAKRPSLAKRPVSDCWAVVLIAAVLRPWSSGFLVTESCRPPVWGKAVRAVTFVVRICSKTGTGQLLSQQWVKPDILQSVYVAAGNARGWHHRKNNLQRLTLVAIADRHAELLQQQSSVPQAPSSRPVVLSNSRVLNSGVSAKMLAHRSFPICILGYKDKN